MDHPLAYFITWRCYGTWLHGDAGAVDSLHNIYGSPFLPERPSRSEFERSLLKAPPMALTSEQRHVCAEAIETTSAARGWELLACNVRSNHVHTVVSAAEGPELVLRSLKARCTHFLRDRGLVDPERPIWSHHGSTRYLWRPADVEGAIAYVVDWQDQKSPRNRSV